MGKRQDDKKWNGMAISPRLLKEKNDDIKRMKIDLVIENNIASRGLSLDVISQKTNIKKIEVQRLLHRYGGIRRYIRYCRLRQAYVELLLNQRSTISKVVEKYGFASLTTFSTVFQKEYGCHPWDLAELEKKARKKDE